MADVYVLPQGLTLQQANSEAGVQALIEQTLQPQPQAVVTAVAQQLSEQVRQRQQLVAMQVAEKNHLSRACPRCKPTSPSISSS